MYCTYIYVCTYFSAPTEPKTNKAPSYAVACWAGPRHTRKAAWRIWRLSSVACLMQAAVFIS